MRMLSLLLALLLLGLTPTAVHALAADDYDAEELERMAKVLEDVYVELTGALPVETQVRRIGDDLYAMTIELDAGTESALAGSRFRTLAVGQQGSIPANPRSLFNPALIGTRAVLNFWWAVYNETPDDIVAASRLTVKGAKRTFVSRSEDLLYPARKITIHWEGKNESLRLPGLYTVIAKVTGAGGRKTSFLATQGF